MHLVNHVLLIIQSGEQQSLIHSFPLVGITHFTQLSCSLKDQLDHLLKEKQEPVVNEHKPAAIVKTDDISIKRYSNAIRGIYARVKDMKSEMTTLRDSISQSSQELEKEMSTTISEIIHLTQINVQIWANEIEKTRLESENMEMEAYEALRSQQGYLLKQGKAVKSWKRRWFVFRKDLTFSYYVSHEDKKKPLSTIDLSKESFLEVSTDASQGKAFTFKMVTKDRTFYLSATNEDEKRRWVYFLKKWFSINKEIMNPSTTTATGSSSKTNDSNANTTRANSRETDTDVTYDSSSYDTSSYDDNDSYDS